MFIQSINNGSGEMDQFKIIKIIQNATLALRNRTRDMSYGVAVDSGKYQLQKIKPLSNGLSQITPLTDMIDLDSLLLKMSSIESA